MSEAPDHWFASPALRDRYSKDSEIRLANTGLLHATNLRLDLRPTNSRHHRKIHLSLSIGELAPHQRLNLQIACGGKNCQIKIGDHVSGRWKISLWRHARVEIGPGSDSRSSELMISRGGHIKIGADCMLAHDILIQCGDGEHALICLKSQQTINKGRPSITIGDHCWLGRKVTLVSSGRNVSVGSGSIVGLGSLVTKSLPRCVTAAGTPARVLREEVTWSRDVEPNDEKIAQVIQSFRLKRNGKKGTTNRQGKHRNSRPSFNGILDRFQRPT